MDEVKILKVRPCRSELNHVYGLYKQSTVGDVPFGECFVSIAAEPVGSHS